MSRLKFLAIIGCALVIGACTTPAGPRPEDLAKTIVAETASAAPPTHVPTNTIQPTETKTEAPLPTDTLTPSPTFTQPPLPAETPTTTATPGPVVFQDDFSEDAGNWLKCDVCEWRDGQLLMGPYPSSNTVEPLYTLCEPCGTNTYFRMSVDVTYVDGPSDRGYGIMFRLTNDVVMQFEITTVQLTFLFQFDRHLKNWEFMNRNVNEIFSGLINPGYATNRIGVEFRPATQQGVGDLYVNINGKNTYVLYNLEAEPGQVGLVVGLHAIRVAFDNFEFEEIEVSE